MTNVREAEYEVFDATGGRPTSGQAGNHLTNLIEAGDLFLRVLDFLRYLEIQYSRPASHVKVLLRA